MVLGRLYIRMESDVRRDRDQAHPCTRTKSEGRRDRNGGMVSNWYLPVEWAFFAHIRMAADVRRIRRGSIYLVSTLGEGLGHSYIRMESDM